MGPVLDGVACVPDLDVDESIIDAPRVLAIQAEPAEAKPNEAVAYRALLVDRLAGLRNTDAFVASNDAPAGSPDYFGSGYTDASGAYWQEINLQALSQQQQFLSISA